MPPKKSKKSATSTKSKTKPDTMKQTKLVVTHLDSTPTADTSNHGQSTDADIRLHDSTRVTNTSDSTRRRSISLESGAERFKVPLLDLGANTNKLGKNGIIRADSLAKDAKPPKRKVARSTSVQQLSANNGKQQQSIDAFFPMIRRTERQCAKDLKTLTIKRVEEAILNQEEEGLIVTMFPGKGRGVVAARSFERDDFVVEYAGDLVDEKEAKRRDEQYKADSTVGCYMYHFVHQDRRFCIDATAETGRLGRLLNHSRSSPNCYTKVIPINGHPYLAIFAKRQIMPGEELLYDYGDRDKSTIEANPWLKS